jgi:SsrA-binding protein
MIASNRRAYHEYTILETLEAGVALLGSEVKSIRAGRINLKDGWVHISPDGEAFLENVHVSHYVHSRMDEALGEKRSRKLLLKRRQLDKLAQSVQAKGLTLVPTKVYLKGPLIKIEIGLAKGKTSYDKRDSQKEKEADREIRRTMKNRNYRE